MEIHKRVYEKTKNFFETLRGAYFKLTTYDDLSKQYAKQINRNLELRGQIMRLEEFVDTLTEQRKIFNQELLDYQKQSVESKTNVGALEEQVETLNNICKRRHKTINDLRVKLREYDKRKIEQIEDNYVQRAKGPDKGHSYIIVGVHSKIVASTLEFRKDFGYNNSDKPIKGLHYFKVLKIPEDSPDYISPRQIKELLKDPEGVNLTTTIIDGKGKEKIIRFAKHVPESFKVGAHNYHYTRVDIYEIGAVKRTFGKVLRKLHLINKKPKTILEFLKQKAITDVHNEAEEEKRDILS